MKTIKTSIFALALGFLFSLISNAKPIESIFAKPKDTVNRIKNIVLVHGAFVDGSGWKPVYDILTKAGFHVSIVQQTLTSFDGDIAAVNRILDMQDGPSILVGHSYGGAIITEAGN